MTAVDDNSESFVTARRSLGLLSDYGIAPTPSAFRVFYAYVRDSVPELTMAFDAVVERGEGLSNEMIVKLERDFLDNNSATGIVCDASELLSTESEALAKSATKQLIETEKFASEVLRIDDTLAAAPVTGESIAKTLACLKAENELIIAQLQQTTKEIAEAQANIATMKDELQKAQLESNTDELTGIGNRRHFERIVAQKLRGESILQNIWLFLIDLDGFKAVNDTYGHLFGDAALRYFASQLRELLPDASLSRLGGDEFAVVIQPVEERAKRLGESICDLLRGHEFHFEGIDTPVGGLSVSIGCAKLRAADSRESWYERTDGLLYEAKKMGKNCCLSERQLGDTV